MLDFLSIILIVIAIFLFFVGVFHLAAYIVKLWTGCTDAEATAVIQNWCNRKKQFDFSNDYGFSNELWTNIRNIIGEQRYFRLERLSQTQISPPLLYFDYYSGLPAIFVTIQLKDDDEKAIIETVIRNLVVKYLRIYGYPLELLVDWKERPDLKMPYLEIRYAKTVEHRRILGILRQTQRADIVRQNEILTDNNAGDDLLD